MLEKFISLFTPIQILHMRSELAPIIGSHTALAPVHITFTHTPLSDFCDWVETICMALVAFSCSAGDCDQLWSSLES